MTLLYADRVLETSTTTGTGTLTLAGAVTGYQTFVDGIGDGNTCYYCITDGTDWEVGRGTVTYGSSDTLSRDSVLSSSNNGSAVSWAAGTRNVFCTIPASRIQLVDPDADPYDWWMDSDGTDAALSGGAAQFTAADKAHLTIADGTQTNLDPGTSDFSLAGWVKFASVAAGEGCVLHKGGTDASTVGYEVYRDATTLKAHLSVNGVLFTATIGTVAASTWYLWAVTFDRNGNATGYLNGTAGTPVDISAQDGQTASSATDFYIGSRAGANYAGMDCCCVGFWDAVLTAGNVTTMWNNGNPLYHADLPAALTTDLISFWDCNEQVIDSTHDCIDKVSATGNDLSFVAAELLSNTGFESLDGADDFASWTEVNSGSNVVSDETTIVNAGSHAAKLTRVDGNVDIKQDSIITLGNAYVVTCYARNNGSGNCRILLGTTSATNTTWTLTSSYAQYTFSTVVSATAGSNVTFRNNTSPSIVYIDDASCKSSRLNTSNGPATAIASDVIGTNHATLMGRTAATSISDWRTDLPTLLQGKRSYSLNHDGTDDYELCNVADFRSADSAGTISAWIKTTNKDHYILASGDTGSDTRYFGFRTRAADGLLQSIQRNNDTQDTCIGTIAVNTGQWVHVVLLSTGSAYKMYVNAVEDTVTAIAGSNTGDWFADTSDRDNVTIGRLATNTFYGIFTGLIAEVRVYSSALSAAQIAELYAGNEATGATPVAQWTFDDGPQGSPGQDSPIINWISSEGSRYQFVQSTLSKCPSYDLSVLNSLPGIYFDGVDDYLTSSTTTILNSTEDTLTIVGKLGASAFDADQVLLACSDTATANYYWEVGIDSAGKFYVENKENDTADRVTGNTVMSPEDDFVLTITSDGFDYYMFVNRVAQTLTVTTGANSGEMPKDISGIDNMTIGGKVDSTGLVRPFEGHIIEILEEADWHGADDVNSIQAPTMKAYTIT
jgi:hypothetical protein